MTRILTFLAIALMLAAVPAIAAKKQAVDAKSEQQKQLEEANAAALADAGVKADDYKQPVCVVTGEIKTMERVEVAPWANGAPTTLTVTEVRILLKPENRRPRNDGVAAQDCPMPASGNMIYKLCSPTTVKAGDRIIGTEGLATGADSVLGCLFDVAVIPKGVPAPEKQPLPAPAPMPEPQEAP